MRFVVDNIVPPEDAPVFVLLKDNWNDWFIWYTMYSVFAVMPDGSRLQLGSVKIGQKGMSPSNAVTQLPSVFTELDSSYFSIGQTENYYETLISLGDGRRDSYLTAIRDCAYSPRILDENEYESVLQNSLLRDIPYSRVRSRFYRLARGEAALTNYSFEFKLPIDPEALTPPPALLFEVKPDALPATNIHVLIGRNGVGKTRCFDLLARTFLGIAAENSQQLTGRLKNVASPFTSDNPGLSFPVTDDPGFAGLVTVSFSAFDNKGPLVSSATIAKRYAYVGLVQMQAAHPNVGIPGTVPRVKTLPELAREFADSVMICREGVRRGRWKKALKTLEADPLFAEANVSALADDNSTGVHNRAQRLFEQLSSGHAAVLLSLTRLVEFVEEKSLVLIDEPEGHLHPPLLSAFVRALSDLLINRNGVAIVATHSPVVLQEVPRSCVWKLGRAGREARADRPEIETFGENVGVLTREVFGLEVTQTGFHKLIAEKSWGRDYDAILTLFGNQLGAEGRGLARALSLIPPDDQDEE
jgi:AAA domain, putative AbiEii toxin, Type IV TA system